MSAQNRIILVPHCAKVTRESGSNFVSSFWFLSTEKRAGLTAIYAFCRLTDDLVDNAKSPEIAKEVAQKWRLEVERAFKGNSDHGVLNEVITVAKKFQIPSHLFFELIDGVEMDLNQNRYKTFTELYSYCYKVASVVGLLCLPVFGAKHPLSNSFAVDLGLAFQLTNILRDIKSDANRGRIYIPEEDLQKFGFTYESFLLIALHGVQFDSINSCKELIFHQCQRAQEYYKKAQDQLLDSEKNALLPAIAMKNIYKSILEKIENQPLLPFSQKVRIGKFEMIRHLMSAWWDCR